VNIWAQKRGSGGGWRKLHNEELHNLYDSSHIIRVIKSRRMRLTGHEPLMGEMRHAYKISVGKSDEANRKTCM
jgi:hypothetical protein